MSKFKVGDKCKFNKKFNFNEPCIKCKNQDGSFTISHVDDDGWAYTCDVLYTGLEPVDDEGWCVGDIGFDVVEE